MNKADRFEPVLPNFFFIEAAAAYTEMLSFLHIQHEINLFLCHILMTKSLHEEDEDIRSTGFR